MMRTLDIWWDGRLVGQLTQDRHGELGFAYAPEWLDDALALPLSASLPKRAEPFSRRECRPFFGGLLPEEGQRDAAAQALGVSRSNDFALLDRLGGDVSGAMLRVRSSFCRPAKHRPLLPSIIGPLRLTMQA